MPVNFVSQSEASCLTLAPPRPIRILRAKHLGMCFGVRDAIALAQREAEAGPLTVLGDLVHNEDVLGDLKSRGVLMVRDAAEVTTATVMITAHGASQQVLHRVRESGLHVLGATCPLVAYAHRCVSELVNAGFHPIIIGQREHVEVRGITEDLRDSDVVLTPQDVAGLMERTRFGVGAQTTQPIERVHQLVYLLRRRFPKSEVRLMDTVCRPTKLRQFAASQLARQSDMVIVIGGAQSNNTRELVATWHRFCERVHHVHTPEDLRPE